MFCLPQYCSNISFYGHLNCLSTNKVLISRFITCRPLVLDGQTDRQTAKQINRDRETERQTNKQIDGKNDRANVYTTSFTKNRGVNGNSKTLGKQRNSSNRRNANGQFYLSGRSELLLESHGFISHIYNLLLYVCNIHNLKEEKENCQAMSE